MSFNLPSKPKPAFERKLPIFYKYEGCSLQKGPKMLPFLKDKEGGAGQEPAEHIKRDADGHPEEYQMLDAIVEDMLRAFTHKNKDLLRGALEAFMEHIREADEIQDQESQS